MVASFVTRSRWIVCPIELRRFGSRHGERDHNGSSTRFVPSVDFGRRPADTVRVMRTRAISILAVVALSLVGAATASADPAVTGYPSSIAATGDSITQAYDADSLFPPGVRPQYSWATGSSSAVNSFYTRILAANPAIAGHAFNDSVTGANMIDLSGQVSGAITQHAQEVAILLGANDVRPSS